MHLPAFYSHAPRVLVRDPLAELLGAADGGLIEYGYADAVRLAGHSCPTVAGAYLMARAGLRTLYPDTLPERGGVVVTGVAVPPALPAVVMPLMVPGGWVGSVRV